jgi:hypothetical protein
VWSGLAKGQIATKHRDASRDHGIRERDEERARRGGSGAVGEDEAELRAARRRVEGAPHGQAVAGILVKRRRRKRRGIARGQGRVSATPSRMTRAAPREIE